MSEKGPKHGYLFVGRVLHNGKEYSKGSPCPPELVDALLHSGAIKKPAPVEKESNEARLDKAPEKKLAELKEKEKKSEK